MAKKKATTEKPVEKPASEKPAPKTKEAPSTADHAKLVAILSYITIIGWIIALILHLQKKTEVGGYHVRQMLLLMIIGIVINLVFSWIPIIGTIITIIVGIALFVLWIIGLIGAIQGQKKPMPLVGPWAQDWFKGL